MEILRAEHITKTFGAVKAVNDVSFSVQAGERVALIGPNGAGKTTLFNCLNGQYKISGGSLHFDGRDITHMPVNERAHLGMARSFQIVTLFSELTVYENVLLAVQGLKSYRYQPFRSAYRYKESLAKTQEMLERMNLVEKQNELVSNLAYGEQRRLEIVLSLASDPRLLLLDEPSCGLTSSECADMTSLISGFGEHITLIMVAHDLDLVLSISTRIIVLHYGELIIDGTPDEVAASPKVQEIYVGE